MTKAFAGAVEKRKSPFWHHFETTTRLGFFRHLGFLPIVPSKTALPLGF
jgi:hypothetical protein